MPLARSAYGLLPPLPGLTCGGLLCWRVPFLVQAALVCVVVLRLLLVPAEHLEIRMGKLQTMNTPSTSTTSNPDPWTSTANRRARAPTRSAPHHRLLQQRHNCIRCRRLRRALLHNTPRKICRRKQRRRTLRLSQPIAEGVLVLAASSRMLLHPVRDWTRLNTLEMKGHHASCYVPQLVDGRARH